MSTTEDEGASAVELCLAEGFVALYRREAEFVLMFCTRRVMEAQDALGGNNGAFCHIYV